MTVPGTEEAAEQADQRFVYRRERCQRCGAAVRQLLLGGRQIYACPVCQPS